MKVIWKDIPEFENYYQASNTGLVKSKDRLVATKHGATRCVKSKILKPQVNYLGYKYVDLSCEGIKKRKTVHQLIFATFNSKFKYGQMVNHINGDKSINVISNLEFSNHVHNNTHAHTLTTTTKPGKSKYRNVSIRQDKRNKSPKTTYVASVKLESKRHYIGSYSLETDAAKAVDSFLDEIGDTLRTRNFS